MTPADAEKDSKRAQKRAQIAKTLSGHVLETGLSELGLRRLAEVAGTSDRMLLYYFENKEDLVATVLVGIGRELAESIDGSIGAASFPRRRRCACSGRRSSRRAWRTSSVSGSTCRVGRVAATR